MIITPLRGWLKDPATSAREKALYAAAALTFFCLPLGTAPLTIAGALAAAVWLFSGLVLSRRRIYVQSYWWPVFALILLPWIGMSYTHDATGIGMDYAEKTYYWLFGFAVAAIPFRRLPAIRLVQAFMLGLGGNVFAAIAQMVFRLEDKNNWHRGLGPDYSTLSAFLIVGIMLGVFFLNRERRGKVKIALVGLIGLYFFHFVMLQSRASYVALVLLTPFIGTTFFRRNKLVKTISLCVSIPCLMMISPIVRDRVALTVEQFTFHATTGDEAAWGKKYSAQQDRFYMWNGAMRIIRENPLFGVGTGGFQTVLKENDGDPDAPLIAHPHNNFLYMAVSFGVPGTAAFLWLIGVTLAGGWRHRQTPEGYLLFSVVMVTVVTGFFNTQILDVGTALFLSLVIGLQQAFPERSVHGT